MPQTARRGGRVSAPHPTCWSRRSTRRPRRAGTKVDKRVIIVEFPRDVPADDAGVPTPRRGPGEQRPVLLEALGADGAVVGQPPVDDVP